MTVSYKEWKNVPINQVYIISKCTLCHLAFLPGFGTNGDTNVFIQDTTP